MKSWKTRQLQVFLLITIGLPLFILTVLAIAGGGAVDRTAAKAVDDASISANVQAQFSADQRMVGHEIDVETKAGVVHLTGAVRNQDQIKLAASLAQKVDGVKSVKNDLKTHGG